MQCIRTKNQTKCSIFFGQYPCHNQERFTFRLQFSILYALINFIEYRIANRNQYHRADTKACFLSSISHPSQSHLVFETIACHSGIKTFYLSFHLSNQLCHSGITAFYYCWSHFQSPWDHWQGILLQFLKAFFNRLQLRSRGKYKTPPTSHHHHDMTASIFQTN